MIAVVSTKGQVVIPSELRKARGITPGTRIVFEEAADGILMRPITPALLSSFRGSFGRKGTVQALLDEKKRERAREDKRTRLL